ncbi:S24 family peptidase [Croceicoccus gelatinilyticus]|uniref:S24 family peptidase n=1 Tax=Croceicoccus gelatinilyticus TaxID=2835536 RepID=UPI001BD0C173|nr:S24 family peptidase [Croceicoccus gelatinilyticus]MBS7668506.1 helix-turn-helix transcriptional regulator [Croceicoccus gelatinilyticus]
MVNDPARNRLVELAEQRGTSLSALSKLIGRNTTYLQQFIKKGSPRKLEENDRRTLAQFFGVDESELGAPDGADNSYVAAKTPRKSWIAIPRLALGASAGPGALAEDDAPVGHLGFSEGWLREMGLTPNALTALSVAGDSMDPTLSDGDEILVARAEAQYGGRLRDGIHVIRRDGTLMVKRLLFEREGQVSVISDNKAYPSDANVPLEEVEVLGRVVWKGGRI